MGSASSSEVVDPIQSEKSRDIERMLRTDKNEKEKILKLLVLGPSDSGKSTLLKQIRIINAQGFSDEEMLEKRFDIYMNLLAAMVEVLQAADRLRLVFRNAASFEDACKVTAYYESMKTSGKTVLSSDVVDAVKRLLADSTIQECLERIIEFNIDDNAKFFLSNVYRLTGNDYKPTMEDILKSRVPTSAVYESSFVCKRFIFKLYDVGGNKKQRRKWIHFFDDVLTLIFVTAISEYNQVLREDATTKKISLSPPLIYANCCEINGGAREILLGPIISSQNRLRDSIELFDNICNNEWFKNTAVVLLLNKIDLFKEKIKHVSIKVALQDYEGPREFRPCLDYIKKEFVEKNKNKKRNIFVHEVCATDTKHTQVVMDSMVEFVIGQAIGMVMNGTGIM